MLKLTDHVIFFLVFFLLSGILSIGTQGKTPAVPDLTRLKKMTARFAPTALRVDTSKLSSGDKQALIKLIEAGRVMNDIFLKQYWSGNPALYASLQRDTTALGKTRLQYFRINKGPWSALDEFEAFLPGVPSRKLPGANFYPEEMTRPDFERWFASLSTEDQKQAKSFFTVIRPNTNAGSDTYKLIPYSEEYKADLTRAANLLREAASLTDNPSLKKFLSLRADASLSNDYYASDLAWMDLDAPLDITIGPYETYDDELFGYKAAFEAFINLRDEEETAKLSAFAQHLQEIEDHLPIDPKYPNPKLGGAAPLRVVDEILSAGDGNRGIATAAYNLPNDARVVQQKGSKRVMLKNVQEAKFRTVLLPIASRILSAQARLDVNFDSFFTHIVAHELMHGLGPHQIRIEDRDTTPREELKELYSAIEEAKADVTGLFALQYMDGSRHRDEPDQSAAFRQRRATAALLYSTYLASMFRSLRFGLNEAHGKGMAIQFNYLMDKGAFGETGDGKFALDIEKFKQAVRDLDHDLLTLEAKGNYNGAKKMLDELGTIRPVLRHAFDKLQDIPTDIEPIFVTAEELAPAAKTRPASIPSRKRKAGHP